MDFLSIEPINPASSLASIAAISYEGTPIFGHPFGMTKRFVSLVVMRQTFISSFMKM